MRDNITHQHRFQVPVEAQRWEEAPKGGAVERRPIAGLYFPHDVPAEYLRLPQIKTLDIQIPDSPAGAPSHGDSLSRCVLLVTDQRFKSPHHPLLRVHPVKSLRSYGAVFQKVAVV